MLERIAKLLNQAENAGTEAEAATFMEKAQQLATVHSIDLARARHATKVKERTLPVQRSIVIGTKGARGLRTLTDLYLGIAAANDIKCTIAHDATVVYAYGFAEDIDVSEALFASLVTQQAKALDHFKRHGEWQNEKVWREGHWSKGRRHYESDWIDGQFKPQTWITARVNFQDAYASRIRHRLVIAKMETEQAQREAELALKANPHLTDDGVLNQDFVDWFADRHGMDLMDEDATATELTEALISVRRTPKVGYVVTILPDGVEPWIAELVDEYVAEVDARPESSGMELVLADKRKAVSDFYAPAAKRARGSYRGGTSAASSSSGRSAGSSAADRASLGRATGIGGAKGAINA